MSATDYAAGLLELANALLLDARQRRVEPSPALLARVALLRRRAGQTPSDQQEDT